MATTNHDDYEELRTQDPCEPEPRLKLAVACSPIPKAPAVPRLSSLADHSPVRSIVSRFEKKQEQSLDALPFRTVRNFFDGDRSIHVTDEKQKYDALTAKQQQQLQFQQQLKARSASDAARANQSVDEASMDDEDELVLAVERKLEMEFADEANQTDDEHAGELSTDDPTPETLEDLPSADDLTLETLEEVASSDELTPETEDDAVPPPPPPPADAAQEPEAREFVNTPEQETKKRPILTTERSFVMEEDHTIETEDLIVVGERFSTDGEDDREMLMELLDREVKMTAEDEAELRQALESNPRKARMIHRKYRKPENVPSKLFAPTAASLASRTNKSPSAVKREPAKPTPKPTTPAATSAVTPTKKSNKYANVQSKVKEMMKPTTPVRRRGSDASDGSHDSAKSRLSTRSTQQKAAASLDRRSFMLSKSNPRRLSGINRTLNDLHILAAHNDWEQRNRSAADRLSFYSTTSSVDSNDPLGLQLSYTARKSRYDNVKPRYLDYTKDSANYNRNKEAQEERRRKLEEANAARSSERQKQLKFQLAQKEKREKEDVEAAVRQGEELHKMTQLIREKEKKEDLERRLSQSAIRRALSSTGSDMRREASNSSFSASSPRTSLLSEPDSIPSTSASGTPANTVFAA